MLLSILFVVLLFMGVPTAYFSLPLNDLACSIFSVLLFSGFSIVVCFFLSFKVLIISFSSFSSIKNFLMIYLDSL